MFSSLRFRLGVALTLLTALAARDSHFTATAHAQEPLTFEQHVRPILKEYCLDCHGAGEKPSGKLDLRLKRFIASGGRNGSAISLKEPARSLLVERMKSGEMPPGEKKVPAAQIALIEKWIAQGAKTLRDEPLTLPPGLGITAEERAYWFYQPLTRPQIPTFTPTDRIRSPIDAFILAKLRQKGLHFNPDADRSTLIRRATFDLTGLPPTQQELDAFLADSSDDAYEKLIDRLLASSAYGERWGRHWLDVVGYADSDGDGSTDTLRPFSWRYRDYVIRALIADKPFDQFILEQLAGDELVPRPWSNLTPAQIDLLAATGFLRTAPDNTSTSNTPADAEQVVTDTLKIVSSTLLGSSLGCAQCHDHRYDPIPQQDYFQIRAIFEPVLDPASWRRPAQRNQSLFTDADRKKAAAVDAEVAKMQAELNVKTAAAVRTVFEKEIDKFPADQRAALKAAFDTPAAKRTPEQKKLVANNPKLNITPGVLYQYDTKLDGEIKAIAARVAAKRAERPVEEFVAVATEVPGRIPATKLHYRGDPRQPKGPELLPADLTIASPEGKRFEVPARAANLPTTGRRLAWAKYLTSGSHPLFNRVQVNRLWMHHFGRGIVDTPGEFGRLGQLPSHPELLDWLATEFPRLGWSQKKLHKLIMTSTVYRQASRLQAADPANLLYSRFPIRRLEAEAVRDRLLVVAGRLDRTPFGPPVAVVEDSTGQIIVPEDKPRRSVYLQARRSKPIAFLTTFDAPAGDLNCDRRNAVTSPQQALALMNSDFVRTQAGHLAARVLRETPGNLPVNLPPEALREFDRAPGAWAYGFGSFDDKSKRIAFSALPHFTGSSWQGGKTLPDAKLGWVILHASGGHAGNDSAHAAIRRWTAPRDGVLRITGQFAHHSPNGDGVRGRIVSSRSGLLGEWVVKNQASPTSIPSVQVKAGDTIDFATDCRADVNSDSFSWSVKLTLTAADSSETWDSASDFQGPPAASFPQLVTRAWQLAYLRSPTPDEIRLGARFLRMQTTTPTAAGAKLSDLTALTNLCQQLLASNEFLYVD